MKEKNIAIIGFGIMIILVLISFVNAELVYYNESFFINANQETFLTDRTFFGFDIVPSPYNIIITEIEKYPECQASYVDIAYVCSPDYCAGNNIYYFDENNKVYPNYPYPSGQDTLLLFFTNQTGFYNMTQRNHTDFLITDLIAVFSVFGDSGNTTAFYNNYDYGIDYTYYCIKSFNYSYYAFPPIPPQNQTGNITGIADLSGISLSISNFGYMILFIFCMIGFIINYVRYKIARLQLLLLIFFVGLATQFKTDFVMNWLCLLMAIFSMFMWFSYIQNENKNKPFKLY